MYSIQHTGYEVVWIDWICWNNYNSKWIQIKEKVLERSAPKNKISNNTNRIKVLVENDYKTVIPPIVVDSTKVTISLELRTIINTCQ